MEHKGIEVRYLDFTRGDVTLRLSQIQYEGLLSAIKELKQCRGNTMTIELTLKNVDILRSDSIKFNI